VSQGEVSPVEFEEILRRQLKLYVQRQLSAALTLAAGDSSYSGTIIYVLRLLAMELDELSHTAKPASSAEAVGRGGGGAGEVDDGVGGRGGEARGGGRGARDDLGSSAMASAQDAGVREVEEGMYALEERLQVPQKSPTNNKRAPMESLANNTPCCSKPGA